MATETGTILNVTSPTTGSITRNSGAAPNPVSYDDPSLEITLTVGEHVVYDIDLDGIVTNIRALTYETGIINEVFSQDTGTITRDNGFDPNPVFYDDATLTTRGIVLEVGEAV